MKENKLLILLIGIFIFTTSLTVFLTTLYVRKSRQQINMFQVPPEGGFQKIRLQGKSEEIGETMVANFSLKQESIIAKSTGIVSETILSKDITGNLPVKINTVQVSFNNKAGEKILIDMVVQILPEKIDLNIIPWFVEGAYVDKFNKTLPEPTLNLDGLRELFDKDSMWIFIPLLKLKVNTTIEEAEIHDTYAKYLNQYYSGEEWSYLKKAYKNKFDNFNFSKPMLIDKLFYLPPSVNR